MYVQFCGVLSDAMMRSCVSDILVHIHWLVSISRRSDEGKGFEVQPLTTRAPIVLLSVNDNHDPQSALLIARNGFSEQRAVKGALLG